MGFWGFGVQKVEGPFRRMYLSLQQRLRVKVDSKKRIVAFMPDFAAYLRNRHIKGDAWKVAYERVKGKTPTTMGLESGEKILYKRKKGPKMARLKSPREYGIFVGIKRKSNEIIEVTS